MSSRLRALAPRGLRGLLLTATALGLAHPTLAQTAAAGSGAVEEVVVTGSRLSQASVAIGTNQVTATVAITRDALLSAPAGITGLKMLESLPGFNVQANDALGMYEFGNSVSVRAFNFQQIGFLLDGIPMGRNDQFGGSPIYRYVDNENLARVSASSGAGDVALPSYSSLGPVVTYVSSDPLERPGARVSETYGSDVLWRNFARLDTGEHAGLSAYVSRSDIAGDLWRGPGTIDRTHWEGKLRYRFGSRGSLSFQTVHNKYFDYDSPSISLAQYLGTAGDPFGRQGRKFAYLAEVPVLAQTTPGVAFSNPSYNQYYKQAINSRQDHLYGLTLDTPIDETLSFNSTVYYEEKEGYGVSPEAYSTSLTNYNAERLIVPGLVAPRGLQYGLSTIDGDRRGITGTATFDFGVNTILIGGWIERDKYHRTQQRYNQVGGSPDGEPLLNEPVHLQRNFVSVRDSTQLFVKDEISLADGQVRLDVGFKSLDLSYKIAGARNPGDFIAGRRPTIRANWTDNFLPQAGLVLELSPRNQLFSSYSENLAEPRGADDIFSAASPAAPPPQAETSQNWEVGFRTNQPQFNFTFTFYRTKFANRLQSFASVVPGTTTTETFYQNVGRVEATGAEFGGQWKPALLQGRVYFSGNLAYNVSKFQDSYSNLAIAGNGVPDFPRWLVQGGVTVEPTSWAVLNVSGRHISGRYTNFINSEKAEGYTVFNAYADIGTGFRVAFLNEVKLRINVDNLFDKDYLGTISTTTNTPATFRPGPRRTFQISLTAAL